MRGAPDIQGPAASAWRARRRREPTDPPDWDGCLAQWQLNSSRFHPFWSWWLVQVIHLRDIPGVRPAVKRYPEAEHELMIVALDPRAPVLDPDEKPTEDRHYRFLTPIDLEHQFHGLGDDGALKLCEGAVRSICDGIISPDQDYRSTWARLIDNTVQHMVLGGHPTEAA